MPLPWRLSDYITTKRQTRSIIYAIQFAGHSNAELLQVAWSTTRQAWQQMAVNYREYTPVAVRNSHVDTPCWQKITTSVAGAENARVENAGVDSRGGKCMSGKCCLLLHFLLLQFCCYRIFHSRIFSSPEQTYLVTTNEKHRWSGMAAVSMLLS